MAARKRLPQREEALEIILYGRWSPDFQGIWTNLSFTPMVRPAKFGNREFLTREEVDKSFKEGVQNSYEYTDGNAADSPFYDSTAYALDAWQNGIQPNPRTSLIVDPPDGQFPPLTPEAAKRRAKAPPNLGNTGPKADTASDQTLGVRCLTFGGPPILPSVTNSDLQIVQSADSVLLEWEWDSTPRIIPLDGRPQLSPKIHRWNGILTGTLGREHARCRDDQLPSRGHLPECECRISSITEYFT